MKKIKLCLFIAIAVLVGCNKSKDTFNISGTVNGAEENTQVVLYTALGDTLAVTNLVDGKFSIEGTVTEPTESYLTFGNPYCSVILENDSYTADIKFNDKSTFTLNGGHLNTLVNKFKHNPKYIEGYKELNNLSKQARDINDQDKKAVAEFMKLYQEKSKVTSDIKNAYFKKIIEGNYSPLEKYFALKNFGGKVYSPDDKIAMTKSYKKEYGAYKSMDEYITAMERYKKSLEAAKTVVVGGPYKDVVANTKTGEAIKLSDVIAKNEYTLLEMWASWCGPCRAEFPHLKKAYSHYKDKGFEIYAISIDDSKEKWEKAVNEEQIPWISTVDYDARNSKATKDYGVLGIPASFLISKEGIIVASGMDVRGTNLDDKLEELFTKK